MWAWLIFVILTVLTWGAYVPTLHEGQMSMGSGKAPLRAFLFVGLAYFVTSAAVLFLVKIREMEPWDFTSKGMSFSFVAGLLGAVGALGIVFALKNGGSPKVVPPLVFAGAPIMNTLVSMLWHKPTKAVSPLFFLGIVVAALGTFMVLKYKPN